MPSDYVIVLTTLPTGADAPALAETLVGEHLAACVNVLPAMQSVYWWKDRVEHEREQQVVIKTTAIRLAAVQARIRELHPYELPEMVVLRIDGGDEAYLNWVSQVTR